MSRTPRSAMIRKAHSLPKGSEERREILAGMGQTWGRQLNELKAEYMQEVVDAAVKILKDEGIRTKGDVRGPSGRVEGLFQGEPVRVHYRWEGTGIIISSMSTGSPAPKGHKNYVISLSPANVASESIYKHFGGLID
jgi:hypothetical protein